MNLVTTLLPGLRDLRAPLATGYLWFLCGWVSLTFIPSDTKTELKAIPLVSTAITAFHDDELTVLAASSLAAYLVGVCFEVFDYAIVIIATLTLLVAIGIFLVILIPTIVLSIAAALTRSLAPASYFVLLACLVTGSAVWVRREAARQWASRRVSDVRALYIRPLRAWLGFSAEAVLRWARPGVSAQDECIVQLICKAQEPSLASMSTVVRALNPVTLHMLCVLCLNDHRLYAAPGFEDAIDGKAATKTAYDWIHHRSDLVAVKHVQSALALHCCRSYSSREILIYVTTDLGELRRLMRRELAHVMTRLHVQHEAYFSDLDRARAEGRLRLAIALPLAVLVTISFGTQSLWAGGTAAAIGTFLALYIQGYRKIQESTKGVISALRTGVVPLTEEGLGDRMTIQLRKRAYHPG